MTIAMSTPEKTLITQATAQAIAALLTPGPWVSVQEKESLWHPERPDSYEREVRATLRYQGDDPLLEGALLDCTAGHQSYEMRHHGDKLQWTFVLGVGDSHHHFGTILLSASKSVARIAKEVQSRLLTPWLPHYREMVTRWRQSADQMNNDHALAEELADILGAKVDTSPHLSHKAPRIFHGSHLWPLSVSGGQVHIERQLHLTPQQAREFCALVATWKEKP